ncbi:DNA mismatch repair endonuclease MutL [Shewanella amazonensis]|uniref:DNA mismatch repair protein MutL n=1 Tax=Shewanella amazonensis (strain ATCC BAA-1098 / SB2B) TaxID=326297 RepID=MUTL_SHEAM|nr:DNA mismatch repair endonuclease MutL [Shewanella amazonensis]A1SA23.1 RecName: Full=DNA mismatch repair protein MutL [Shewanella amazonensis SB2B]ABM01230.1 DNA mismatch repair protein MutL [Shewanella amazonensis SB2B]
MAIQVLPPQLANQIAAGEVVERPASVIKELVENSLDAGATRVDIDIDKGGSKLIRIRDNGGGIPKAELALALARHATSKVQTLEDLEAILSFGFRGEALASISSVSRLTLTSRTTEQAEAWQAYAEGSEVAIRVMPAAHPVGTTIEVADLFFNTPARRRFLKSDKTEFTHIDEWLKRIALIRSDVHFSLSHNGKPVRQYRCAATDTQYLQRLAQVAGRAFADSAIKVDCQHDGMGLSGYLQSPALSDMVDCHYFYVNGRLIRDRLVNHAVRQAFGELGTFEQPAFVLSLTLDPHQVDVNVHPAKHEVRFHQARYVHDFILQVLQSALSQMQDLPLAEELPRAQESPASVREHTAGYAPYTFNRDAATEAAGVLSSLPDTQRSQRQPEKAASGQRSSVDAGLSQGSSAHRASQTGLGQSGNAATFETSERHGSGYSGAGQGQRYVRDQLSGQQRQAAQYYAELLHTPEVVSTSGSLQAGLPMPPLLAGRYWVLAQDEHLRLLSISDAAKALVVQEILSKLPTGLVGQPLLMPVAVAADADWTMILAERESLLRRLGLELTIRYQQLIIKKVPPYLRDSQLAKLIPEFLEWIKLEVPADEALCHWLAQYVTGFDAAPKVWQRIQSLEATERNKILESARDLPWQTWLDEYKH